MLRSNLSRARPRLGLGLTAAALVGWALLVLLVTIEDLATARWWAPWWKPPLLLPPFFPFYSTLGLPVAFMFCFAVGTPAWLVAHWLGLRRRRAAAATGALAGMVLNGLLAIPAAHGAYQAPPHYEPFTAMLFTWPGIGLYIVMVGVIAGLVARWVAGAKSLDRARMAGLFA